MVNAGPIAIAKTFLGEYEKYNASHVCKLRETLREFNKVHSHIKMNSPKHTHSCALTLTHTHTSTHSGSYTPFLFPFSYTSLSLSLSHQCIYFALKIYQRCVSEGKSEGETEGERPSTDLDFATVVAQEFETKFKVTVEKLIKESAGWEGLITLI